MFFRIKNWENEISENISAQVNRIPLNLSDDDRVEIVDAIIITEAKKLQDKYYHVYNMSAIFPWNWYIHDTLKPLYEQYTFESHLSNSYVQAFASGFIKGLHVGAWHAALTYCQGNTQGDNYKIYRKMSVEEYNQTMQQSKLQPQIPGADKSKWTSDSLQKVIDFTNDSVPVGTEEYIVEFQMNSGYYNYLKNTAIPQAGSKGQSFVKYHFEGLEVNGQYRNYSITPEELGFFNQNIGNIKLIQIITKQ